MIGWIEILREIGQSGYLDKPFRDQATFKESVISNSEIKATKKFISLTEKLEIIKLYESGMFRNYQEIANAKKLPESTVRCICNKKEKLKHQASFSNTTDGVFKKRSRIVEQMEKKLSSWILHERSSMSKLIIQEKARSLFSEIKDEIEDKSEDEIKETFKASNGWYSNFQKRAGLKIKHGTIMKEKGIDSEIYDENRNVVGFKENYSSHSDVYSNFIMKKEVNEHGNEILEGYETKDQRLETSLDLSVSSDSDNDHEWYSEDPLQSTQPVNLKTVNNSDSENEGVKITQKSRKHLTLKQKLGIIKLNENGLKFSAIGKMKGLPESTVRGICKMKEKYKDQGFFYSVKTKSRTFVRMEELLSSWLLDLEKRDVKVKIVQIQAKAKSLFEQIKSSLKGKTDVERKETFSASNGWLFKLQNRLKAKNGGKLLKISRNWVNEF